MYVLHNKSQVQTSKLFIFKKVTKYVTLHFLFLSVTHIKKFPQYIYVNEVEL